MGFTNNIVLKKIWQDVHCLEVKITCSSCVISATTQVYLTENLIDNLCYQIEKFCNNTIETFEWKSGDFGDSSTACVMLAFSRKDTLGHILIEVSMELDDGASFSKHNCCFYVHAELGQLCSFGEKVAILLDRNSVGYSAALNSTGDGLGDKGTVCVNPIEK